MHLFDEQYYLANNPDVAVAISLRLVSSGLHHFETFGKRELRDPNAFFDSRYYAQQNPDVVAAVADGRVGSVYEHFLSAGAAEGRRPKADIDVVNYLRENPDVAVAVMLGVFKSALHHYIAFGHAEGRKGIFGPSGTFGTESGETLTGTANGDNIDGRGGNDIVVGAGGNDTLAGGADDDQVVGGAGSDRLTGGAGADTFVYYNASESTAANPDVITDFNGAAGDRIYFSSLLWPPLTFLGAHTQPFTATNRTELRFNDTTKLLEVDLHGAGTVDMVIKLEGVSLADITAGWFTGTMGSS